MSAISAVGSSYGGSYSKYYGQIASGSKLNRAADGAAELAIANKMQVEDTGMQVGSNNLKAGMAAVNIQDGALGQVTDSLQRMRELAVQASNGLLSDSDRSSIQGEIDQLKQGLTDVVTKTNYNGLNLTDGTLGETTLVGDADGSTMALHGANATLEALGIADFDVTSGNFDLSQIDKALDTVSAQRSQSGAAYNAYERAVNYNANASYNLTSAKSKMEDTDIGETISKLKKQQTLNTYSMYMQRRRQEDEQKRMLGMFANM
ncbi:MAG: flagellin [Lachnospiraceae bacterium]|nr:flagellin [Lachnospiraceae bacterium]